MKRIAQFLLALPLAASPDKPNILRITSENNSSSWLGCYCNTQAITPQLDALASQGLRFTRAYSNVPVYNKTDYNFLGNDKALWDEYSGKAHYKNRASGQPFFAVINYGTTHESQLFPTPVAKNRNRGIIVRTPRIDPAKLVLPPYLPDLPEIRSDIATYHDNITALDTQVGKMLSDLKESGLAEDTTIIYCSDHG